MQPLRAVVEIGLRRVLSTADIRQPYVLPDHSVGEAGGRDPLEAYSWQDLRHLIGETDDFLEILERFVQRPRVIGGVAHDARIAAICVAHGAEALLTGDRDFSLFPELKTRDPIAG